MHVRLTRLFLVLASCGLMASQCGLEELQPSPLPSGAVRNSDLWSDSLQKDLKTDGVVRVVYLPKNGKKYSAIYDVSEQKILMAICRYEEHVVLIRPMAEVLSDAFLQGYVCKKGLSPPHIQTADFGVKDMTLAHYDTVSFRSETLKHFLIADCPVLARRRKASFDGCGRVLTADMCRKVVPIFQDFLWEVTDPERFLQAVTTDKRDNNEVFLVIGGVGILGGTPMHSRLTWGFVVSEDCVYAQKVRDALGVLAQKHPFSRKEWKHCINYIGFNAYGLECLRLALDLRAAYLVKFLCVWRKSRSIKYSLQTQKFCEPECLKSDASTKRMS